MYDSVLQEQRGNEIIEKVEVEEVNETISERVSYLPYRPVIRESAETTKIRFHWDSNLDRNRTEVNRCTSLVFGLTQSPFVLEGTLKKYFNNYKSGYPELIENIRNDMYVDDLVSGGNIVSEVELIKQNSIELFAKNGLNLHKWHSNISLLQKSDSNNNDKLTYVKQVFPTNTSNTRILDLSWNKASDTLFVIIPKY